LDEGEVVLDEGEVVEGVMAGSEGFDTQCLKKRSFASSVGVVHGVVDSSDGTAASLLETFLRIGCKLARAAAS